MGKIELVSNNAGMHLLYRNTIHCIYPDVIYHKVVINGFSYHSSLTSPNLPRAFGNTPLKVKDFLKTSTITTSNVLFPVETAILRAPPLHNLMRLEEVLKGTNVLVIAFAPLCTILYRLYKQIEHVLPPDQTITIVRAKLDKQLLRSRKRNTLFSSILTAEPFEAYSTEMVENMPKFFQYKGALIDPTIPNGFLTKNACKSIKGVANANKTQKT